MMNRIERIERYLQGKLEEGDLWEFKKALEVDAEFAEEVKLYKELLSMQQQAAKETLLDTMQHIHQENKPSDIQRFMHTYRYAAVAAAFALLFGIGMLLTTVFSGTTNQQLYSAYFQPEQSILNVRSTGISMEHTVMQGLQYYELNDYQAALEMFEMAPTNLMGKLYSGIALMELSEFNSAVAKFNYIIQHNDNLFVDQAEWYLSLCYLKQDKTEDARLRLAKIAEDRGIYKVKAQKLLNEMKNK